MEKNSERLDDVMGLENKELAVSRESKEYIASAVLGVRQRAQESIRKVVGDSADFDRIAESIGLDVTTMNAEQRAVFLNYLKQFEERLEAVTDEYMFRILDAGFNLSALALLDLDGIAGTDRMVQKMFSEGAMPPKLGQGGSKRAYLLPDGRVLKYSQVGGYIDEIGREGDEIGFYRWVLAELGVDAVSKVLVQTEFIGEGVPATIQERALQTSKAIRLAQEAGDAELASLIQQAHAANPLCKFYLFEQKVTNTGLIRREDGNYYVVAFDTSGDGRDLGTAKSWDEIKAAMKGIVPISPEILQRVPALKAELDKIDQGEI